MEIFRRRIDDAGRACRSRRDVLSKIFRVELYSLRITGGLVVFLIGWTAIREGRFMQKRHQS